MTQEEMREPSQGTKKAKRYKPLSEARLDYWRGRGLVSAPVSEAQALFALAARDFVDGLRCHEEVERLVALGRSPKDVAQWIRENQGEGKEKKLHTVRKYLLCYARFWITPMFAMRIQAEAMIKAEKTNDGGNLTEGAVRRIAGIREGVDEIGILETAIEDQVKRYKKMLTTEDALSGLALPHIRHELITLRDLIQTVLEWKVDLGYPGYRRVPQRLDINARVSTSTVDSLNQEERKKLLQFGELVKGWIEMIRNREGKYEIQGKKEAEHGG